MSLNCTQPKIALFSLCALLAAAPMLAQSGPPVHVGNSTITGIPQDWSHRHVVFSNPGTEAEAFGKGKHAEWQNIVSNPRYVVQQLKNNHKVEGPASSDTDYWRLAHSHDFAWNSYGKQKKNTPSIERDWSESLGTGAGLADGQYPAKFNYYTQYSNCSDYVVFPTGANGATGQATIVAFNSLYSGCPLFNTGTQKPVVYWAVTTGTGYKATTSPVLSADGTQVAYIQTNGTSAQLVLLKMATGGTVTSPATPMLQSNSNYRACTAPCYTTLALQNAGGTVNENDTNSAPFYVFGGTLADTIFVGDDAGLLHQVTNVFLSGTPTIDSGATYPVTASTQTPPALYSPVYDAGTSASVFVTDKGGYLHRIVASSGTVTTSGRLENNTSNVFDSPIVDSTTEEVYTFSGYSGDTGCTNCSYINYFAAGTALASGNFGTGLAFNNGGTNNPATSHMHAGTFDNLYYTGTNTTGSQGHLYVCENGTLFQVNVTSRTTGALGTGTPVTLSTPVSAVGTASACSPVTEFLGDKVAVRTTAALTAASTTVPVVSGTGIANNDYLQIDSEIMQVTLGGGTTSLTVTRAANGTTAATHTTNALAQDIQDWLFLSVIANGNATVSPTCSGACVYNYNVIASPATANPVDGLAATGGTSGIVIDSSDTGIAGDQEIYYTQLGSTNAIQASQAALQ